MAEQLTRLNRNEIAASGLGVSPRGIAAIEDLQNAAFDTNPAASQAAAEQAFQASGQAVAAGQAADAAQLAADTANASASSAFARANDAYSLAEGKVSKSAGPSFAAPTGPLSRTPLAGYVAPAISDPPTKAEVQALVMAVEVLSRTLSAVIVDLRANEALTP